SPRIPGGDAPFAASPSFAIAVHRGPPAGRTSTRAWRRRRAGTLLDVIQSLRNVAKKVLPMSFIDWYRRRRQVRAYLKALGYELHERQTRLDQEDIEEKIAARHDGFYQRAVKEVLERTELVLQALDRKIEGLGARHGHELLEMRHEVSSLRDDLRTLTSPASDAPEPSPADGSP